MGSIRSIASAFVEARRTASGLPGYPGERPADLATAYQIQDTAIAIDGRAILGWKVGRINAPLDSQLGSNRLAGPIFVEAVVDIAGGDVACMPVFADGFAAAEAELLLHIAPGNAHARPQNDAETRAIIDEVRIGIEIASSPYPGINADGPTVTTSDYGNNHGLVMGAALEGWQDIDLCAIPVCTTIDGRIIGEATAATMLDGPYGAVRFLLGNLAERGIDISGGAWVSSGAITGVHAVTPGQAVEARFGTHGSVRCTIGVAKVV
ncbi:MAG: 2-keto-4-pentenoate hydratase [Novosphingobium sp.]